MDDYSSDDPKESDVSTTSSSNIIEKKGAPDPYSTRESSVSSDTTQTVKSIESRFKASRATATNALKKIGASLNIENVQTKSITSTEPYCHVKLDSIVQLKDSTKQLLALLEEIQLKSKPRQKPQDPNPTVTSRLANPIASVGVINSVTGVCSNALKKLETQTQLLESIATTDEDDDCSVFKKLTRKCNCLTQREYNDFVIHFNENTNLFTSTSGEIIKNLRILKRFVYMGGDYTKHALMFLNEGLGDSSYTEKVDIVQGCAHTDMCNVFEDISIVISCIAWPYKYDSYGDSVTQELAASFLLKLALLEEGRRYLKFTSRISNDIKKVFRLKGSKLDFNTIDSLHATLDAMNPQNVTENVNTTYYCRPSDEGFGTQTMNELIQYRRYMTMVEIFTHMDVLKKLSCEPKGKVELLYWLKPLLVLFEKMLVDYDDSEMNIIVTQILENLISKDNLPKQEEAVAPTVMMVADTATEPIPTKANFCQIPEPKKVPKHKKYINKNRTKSRLVTPTIKGPPKRNELGNIALYNRSKKFPEISNIALYKQSKKFPALGTLNMLFGASSKWRPDHRYRIDHFLFLPLDPALPCNCTN